jgi:glutathione S-transferase
MIKLYDSAFSPFARKVRMVLEYKGLNYEVVDGLLRTFEWRQLTTVT